MNTINLEGNDYTIVKLESRETEEVKYYYFTIYEVRVHKTSDEEGRIWTSDRYLNEEDANRQAELLKKLDNLYDAVWVSPKWVYIN